MICTHCATPISQDDDGTWYHDAECPKHTPCWRGDKGATPHVDLNAKYHDEIVASIERENEYWRAIHFPPRDP